MSKFDVLMIGNFAKDKLIVDGIEEISSGGGVYYGSIVIKRLGRSVAVVTRLHPDDFPRLVEMKEQGVEVFAKPASGTSGIANYYKSSDMETRICKPIGFGGKYILEEIPDLTSRIILLSPLFAGEIDLKLLQELSKRAPVGLDIQGFVRVPVEEDLIFKPWEDLEAGLRCITYLKVDKAEAEYLTGFSDLHKAALKLHSMGPKEIVITQSSGVTVFAEDHFYTSAFTPRSLAGRTGRGDTCFSTYIAKRLTESAEVACEWAGVVTTFKQEIPGPWMGSRDEIENEILRRKTTGNLS